MDSPPQTVMVRGGDFFVGKRGRKLCRACSCGEKAIGFGGERLFDIAECSSNRFRFRSSRLFFLCYNEKSNHEIADSRVYIGIIGENVKPVLQKFIKKHSSVGINVK